MKNSRCKFCGNLFKPTAKRGAVQEYCSAIHRRYENSFRWLSGLKKKSRPVRTTKHPASHKIDADMKKKIEEAVNLTVKEYAPTLKKLAKQ